MKLDILKQFSTRSDRVKGIDFHPSEPWVLTTLYNGKVEIWSYETNQLIKSIQVTDVPIRTGKFIARKNWLIVGADDYQVRVYNYNTSEKIIQFEAHPDYIRSVAIHPTKPFVLTSSDDMTIKLWNWEKNWKCEQIFEGHQHYVMSIAFNPKDPNTFASACLDKTVKLWSLGLSNPNLTLLAHEFKGVNFVDYYPQADKPYLITTSDDKTIRIWDLHTKSPVAKLEGHTSNVSFAIFHPELPLIVSGSEDGTVKIWNSNTYKLEKTLNYGYERVWCVSYMAHSNLVAVGCDSGHFVVKLGNEEPLYSMDSMGKIIFGKHSEIYQSVIKTVEEVQDGEYLPLQQKELGSVEIFPQTLKHSPNGRFVTVTGDGEYIIYTALAWRNKAYGNCLDFVWAQDSNSNLFAIRESPLSIKIYKNFKEKTTDQINLIYQADKIFGGALVGVKSEGFISFYDWESGDLVRRVDVDVQDVIWSDNGELITIVSNDGSAYILKYDSEIYHEAKNEGEVDEEEGVEAAFEVLYDFNDSLVSGKWVGDVFVYSSSNNRLNYFVGGETLNISHFDKKFFILGYLPKDNKIYVIDKDLNVSSYYLSLNVLEFQTLVLRGDLFNSEEQDPATIIESDLNPHLQELISSFSVSDLNKVSRFLEKQNYLKLALSLTNDNETKFELSIKTLNLDNAYEIAKLEENESKWKKLGDLALKSWKFNLAIECFQNAKDYPSLLLLHTSTNNTQELKKLADNASTAGKYNIAFNAFWTAGDLEDSIDVLVKSGRVSEAAIMARTYGLDSQLEKFVELWKEQLNTTGKKDIAERLIVGPQEEVQPDLIDVEDVGIVEEREEVVTADVEPVSQDLLKA